MLWISLSLPPPPCPVPPDLGTRLLRYTPHLAQPAARTWLLEIQPSLRLFGGIRALLRAVRGECPAGTRSGMAPTALGAQLLAWHGQGPRHVVRLPRLARRLDALPCTLLPLPDAQGQALQALGCDQLGKLRRLPRIGLRNRGHGALVQLLDQAYGHDQPAAPAWFSPARGFSQACELEFHSRSAPAILAAATPLVQAACAWLDARQQATRRLEFLLFHDPRRSDPSFTPLTLRTSRPEWLAPAFLRLLQVRLDRQRLPAAVVRIQLLCPHAQPRVTHSHGLLPDEGPSPGRESALLDTLRARLGMQCLRFPDPLVQHIPERTDRWHAAPGKAGKPAALPVLSPHSRPLWLLRQALPLPAPGHRPLLGGQPLRLVAGPERIEGAWWVPGQSPVGRDYFVARDRRGARYWVYRDHQALQWFLQGLFG